MFQNEGHPKNDLRWFLCCWQFLDPVCIKASETNSRLKIVMLWKRMFLPTVGTSGVQY